MRLWEHPLFRRRFRGAPRSVSALTLVIAGLVISQQLIGLGLWGQAAHVTVTALLVDLVWRGNPIVRAGAGEYVQVRDVIGIQPGECVREHPIVIFRVGMAGFSDLL